MKRFILLTSALIITAISSIAQGNVHGKVTDQASGESIYSATIVVKGTTKAAISDFDGLFSLDLEPGTYTIDCVSMGLNTGTKTITVVEGQDYTVNFEMAAKAVVIDKKANIIGRVDKSRDAYLEGMKKKDASVMEVISAKDVKKTGESDVAGLMKRVSGVSKVGNQIYVRGLSDRYIKATLNGAEIPSIDTRKNSADLDIFPTKALDNVSVVKSARANLPGDFSGAYINMKTKEFPSKLNLNYSLSFNYNTNTTFRDVLGSETGKRDWLAADDGTRELPSIIENSEQGVPQIDYGNYYTALVAAGYEDELNAIGVNGQDDIGLSSSQSSIYDIINQVDGIESIDQVNSHLSDYRETANQGLSDMAKSFSNSWDNKIVKAPIDMSHSLTFGNSTKLFNRNLGYNIGFVYRTRTRHYEDGITGRYKLTGSEDEATALNTESTLSDSQTSSEVMINTLFNVSYELDENNTVSAVFMPTRSARNVSRYQDGLNYSDENGLHQEQRTQVYNERKMNVYQLNGRHDLESFRKAKFFWNATMVDGTFSSPDFKVMYNSYTEDGDDINYDIFDNLYPSPTRFFRNLHDRTYDAKANLEYLLSDETDLQKSKLYFGYSYVERNRTYSENRYSFVNSGLNYDGDVDSYFDESNLNVIPGGEEGYIYLRDDSESKNNYTARQVVQSAYGMIDYYFNPKFFANAGIRFEQTNMNLESMVVQEENLSDAQAEEFRGNLDNLNVLPSVNLMYKLIAEDFRTMNLRGAFYSTVARPVFREKAPYSAFDFDQQEVLTGNVDLVSTQINNYDLRWEYYPRTGEILSASVFYKDFTNPIEQVIVATASNVEITWENAEKAQVYGMEFEAKKNLGFVSSKLSNYSFGANLTLVKSQTQIAADELAQIRATDLDAEDTRPMYGQSPYIANAIVSYNNDSIGFNVNVSYNIQGERLVLVTKGGTPDIYQQPRNLINITVGKKLNDHFNLSFKAMNILNARTRNIYLFNEEDYDRQSFDSGVNFSLGLSYTM